MLLRILEVITPVFGIIAVGYVYGRLRPADMSTANRLNINIFTPALLFFVLTEQMTAAFDLYAPALGAALIVLGSGVVGWPILRALGWELRTGLPPLMFNNCGNLGLPLAVFAYGEAALPMAVAMFVVSNALQFTLGIRLLAGRSDWRVLFTNPMVLATAAGLVCMAFDAHAPGLILPGIEMLANVAIPLMLFALGVRLTDVDLSHWRVGLIGGLLTPATGLAIAIPWVWLSDPEPTLAGLLLIFGALPAAVLNYMLAEYYRREPERVAAMVAIGNALSLLVMPMVLAFAI